MTVKRTQLEEAFISESSMNGFIGAIYGEVQNAIELSLESLARNCINNFIGEKLMLQNKLIYWLCIILKLVRR